jgi:hypothetical protein
MKIMQVDVPLNKQSIELFRLFSHVDSVLQIQCKAHHLELVCAFGVTSIVHLKTAGSKYICSLAEDSAISVNSKELFETLNRLWRGRHRTVRITCNTAELKLHVHTTILTLLKPEAMRSVLTSTECTEELIFSLPTYAFHDVVRKAAHKKKSIYMSSSGVKMSRLLQVDVCKQEGVYRLYLNGCDSLSKLHVAGSAANFSGKYNASHLLGSIRPVCAQVRVHCCADNTLVFKYVLQDKSVLDIFLKSY